MKLTLREEKQKELEVIIIYPEMDGEVKQLIERVKGADHKVSARLGEEKTLLGASEIYYIETLERKTFIYTEKKVYRAEDNLMSLLKQLKEFGFVQVSRACILNINVLKSIKTIYNSKLEATLSNNERINISRTYMHGIKEMFQKEERK